MVIKYSNQDAKLSDSVFSEEAMQREALLHDAQKRPSRPLFFGPRSPLVFGQGIAWDFTGDR